MKKIKKQIWMNIMKSIYVLMQIGVTGKKFIPNKIIAISSIIYPEGEKLHRI